VWEAPLELPDLRGVGTVAIDTETRDDGLRDDRGSAWPWGGGHVAGISIAYRADGDVRAHYLPLRHPETSNLDPKQVFHWLRDLVKSDLNIVGHNTLYDFGWLRADGGVPMPKRLEETSATAMLADENRFSYRLDDLCRWRGLPCKDETLLVEAATARGIPPKKVKENLWQLPAEFVGPYAEQDAISTLLLFENLRPILEKEGTYAAYELERDLLPMVLEMRARGNRIDQGEAEHARDVCLGKRDAALAELGEKLGAPVSMHEIAGRKWKTETFDAHRISYPRTAAGNPSFQAGKLGWMDKHPHWLPQLIAKANKYHDAGAKFLEGHILAHLINGRVHPEIHPHRAEDGGARSLRFSYSNPPLQQMPSRDKELASLIRGVFLPEEGEAWCKPDISQQEFRFVVHHAVLRDLPRALEAAEYYRRDPDADFHASAAEMTGLARDDAKAANFAKIFGAGVKKFAQMIGKPLHEAQAIYAQYDRELPFISHLAKICEADADRLGYTVLYDGAHRHWDYRDVRGLYVKGLGPCPLEEARRRIADPESPWFRHPLQRSRIHTALNAQIQGDGARHTKLWMRACWREGIVPLLQMHDALDCSVTSPEQGELVARLGCEAVKLEVPIRVDVKYGHSWGDAKHAWSELPARPAPKVAVQPGPSEAKTERPPEPKAAASNYARLPDVIGRPLADGKINCPFHDDATPSCHVYDDHFHCFGCGARGDAIDWLIIVENLTRDQAIALLTTWQGQAAPARRVDDGYNLKRALRLWEAAEPINGVVRRYLADVRGIDADIVPAGAPLRFHPRCAFGRDVFPCLLALFSDVEDDSAAGIHRIALTPDVFAGGKVQRMMLGSWARPRAIKLWPANGRLFVGEGIETVLAASTLEHCGAPMRPAWAVGSSVAIRKLPPIAGVDVLGLLVDHDHNGVSQGAAAYCAARWSRSGKRVLQFVPDRPGADFNDVVKEKHQ
jgi:DNA polymerase I-like protein with 3'-5' exonuclease and polymerase domains